MDMTSSTPETEILYEGIEMIVKFEKFMKK